MASSIFLQNTIFTSFILPFLLIFVIAFAIMEKVSLFGKEKTQLHALTSFILALIFVAAFNYANVVNNLVLFLVIAIVIFFVALLMWGFLSGEGSFGLKGAMRTIILILLFIAVAIGVIWAFGIPISGGPGSVSNLLFNQVWSQPFWTNLIFIILIGVALAVVLGLGGKKSS